MATTTNNGWTTPDDTDLVKDGALAIRDLGQEIDTSVGEGLLAWKTWAPTLSAGWLNGNGTYIARYAQIGKIVHVYLFFTVGSTTTKGTGMTFSLPVTAAANQTHANGNSFQEVAGTGFQGLIRLSSTTTAINQQIDANGTYLRTTGTSATVPATWATGNTVYFNFTYQAA
jgi:hypothetical protein